MVWERIPLLLAADQAALHLEDMASALGLIRSRRSGEELEQKEREKKTSPEPATFPEESLSGDTTTGPAVPDPARFWRIETIERFQATTPEIPSYLFEPVDQDTIQQDGTYIFDLPTPVVSFASLVPLLFNGLGEEIRVSRPAWDKLVKIIATGRPIRKIPRHREKRWPRHVTVIRDRHKNLFPYWHDFESLIQDLQNLLGKDRVTTLCLDEQGPDTLLPCPPSGRSGIPPESAVLVLSNLDDFGSIARELAWQAFFRRLTRHGCRIITLSPASRSPADFFLCRLSRPHSLFQHLFPVRQPSVKGFSLPVQHDEIETALTMIAPLPLVDRGLLRKLRREFSWGTPPLEGIVWNHDKIMRSYLGIRISLKHKQEYEQRFASLDPAVRDRFWALVHRHHEKGYPGLKSLEQLSQAALEPALEKGSIDLGYYKTLLAQYCQTGADNPEQEEPLRQQLRTMLAMIPATVWQRQDALQEFSTQAFAVAFDREIREGRWPELPPGLLPSQVPRLESPLHTKSVVFALFQESHQGRAIVCEETTAEQHGGKTRAAQVVRFTTSPVHPATLILPGENRQRVVASPLSVTPDDKPLIFAEQTARYHLQAVPRPTWAEAIGRDRQGLFVETRQGDPATRVYWLPEEVTADGRRLAATWFPCVELGEELGRDHYGVYWELNIRDIVYRCRWIPPGTFLMGSPKDEPERDDDEKQHPVTLTRGFWLGETTVTQELYKVVMGINPSRFRGKKRPVENVSWQDCQEFCKKLQSLPETKGLTFHLPTEAQWEYGCRAGTTTPFSFGANITPEQVNYNGNYPYNNGNRGLYRRETVEVRSLPCNAWGLYEMHGNVWEWCRDWYGEYPDGPVQDPEGPGQGGLRVLRGGSWFIDGGRCRSAFRLWVGPGSRDGLFGFRLSPGQSGR